MDYAIAIKDNYALKKCVADTFDAANRGNNLCPIKINTKTPLHVPN